MTRGRDADPARTALLAGWAAMRDAMELGDVDVLDDLLADDWTLTHMTGEVQTKAAWLADVDAGAMRYHRVEDVETAVRAAGPAPVVTARTMTEATIRGVHGTWPLQLRCAYRPEGDRWVATQAVATIW